MSVVTKRECNVLMEGSYFCDLVFSGLPELPRLGHEIFTHQLDLIPGGAYNSAVALRRLGLNVAWPVAFGSDPFSQYVQEHSEKEGLDPAFFTQTGSPSLHVTVAFSFESERAFLSYSEPTAPAPLTDLLRGLRPSWLLLTRLSLEPEILELMLAARSLGTRIFMDCQAHDHGLSEMAVQQALQLVDVFSPNETEACRLAQMESVEAAAEALGQLCPLVVIKLGAHGCLSRKREETLRVPAIRVGVVDTTGAGDNFDSGFLCGQLRGYSLEDSLRMANICGGLSTQGCGGTASSPTYEQVQYFMEQGIPPALLV